MKTFTEISSLVTETLGHCDNTVAGFLDRLQRRSLDNPYPAKRSSAESIALHLESRSAAACCKLTGRDNVYAPEREDWFGPLVEACQELVDAVIE